MRIKSRGFGLVVLTVGLGLPAGTALAAKKCINFDGLVLGTTYTAPFVADGVNINVLPFFFTVSHPCAGGTTFGFAQVDPSGLVPGGSPPHELEVNNVRLGFVMADFFGGAPVKKLTMKYSELGGTVDIQINGDCYVLNNFTDLPPGIYAGVKYNATPHKITLKRKGAAINNLQIGGQELWIDDVCAVN